MFCSYKNIFGKPGEGVHETRVFGLAAFDVMGLLLLNWVISYQFNIAFLQLLPILILITVVIHWLFCVPTALNVALGVPQDDDLYIDD